MVSTARILPYNLMAYIVVYISMALTYTFIMFITLAQDLRPMFTALAKTTAATVLCNQPRLNMLAARYFILLRS